MIQQARDSGAQSPVPHWMAGAAPVTGPHPRVPERRTSSRKHFLCSVAATPHFPSCLVGRHTQPWIPGFRETVMGPMECGWPTLADTNMHNLTYLMSKHPCTLSEQNSGLRLGRYMIRQGTVSFSSWKLICIFAKSLLSQNVLGLLLHFLFIYHWIRFATNVLMGSASYPIITLLTLDIICAMSTFPTAINSMRAKLMTLFVQFSIQIIDTKHTFVEKKKKNNKSKI